CAVFFCVLNSLKFFWLITTFPVSCIFLLIKPPIFSFSCSYGTFIGFLSVLTIFGTLALIYRSFALYDLFFGSHVHILAYDILFFVYTDLFAHVYHLLLFLIAHVLNHILVV